MIGVISNWPIWSENQSTKTRALGHAVAPWLWSLYWQDPNSSSKLLQRRYLKVRHIICRRFRFIVSADRVCHIVKGRSTGTRRRIW